jgi:hypothetical protein
LTSDLWYRPLSSTGALLMRKEESLRLRKTVHDVFSKKDSQNEASLLDINSR